MATMNVHIDDSWPRIRALERFVSFFAMTYPNLPIASHATAGLDAAPAAAAALLVPAFPAGKNC
ncbi:hypothetical protein BCV53_05605 [Parageobacillus thermoglucosidasius]|uniref:Uncharacterized protein n=1 Tax=Parageobacillus thermoglucosidasius TaxID=1426 RepID=A0AAN1D667_PARTM|nr:hypothetical protein AOT13_05590 [Parageobacillus thermoglucosidasius]ANZ29611.1 hypothetical protein BCV53_05605 [Parageobacillus thermoglucosidasius]APM80350.1 hypothetical protein BCV54_05610 [Parageobacillus thermoglucosidasius]KJX70110.1 hypothetical protein WH82_02740 [Parageobacillus thermoglucosidasius]RDE20924.1 hypothetical protein DV712_12105 [Parageobacillus thermoglucosidasius]